MPPSGQGLRELGDFITASFTRDEIERIARLLDGTGSLSTALPGPTASWAQVAHGFVSAAMARGLLDSEFFMLLLEERPRKTMQIEAIVQRMFPRREHSCAGRASSSAVPGAVRRTKEAGAQWWVMFAALSLLTIWVGSVVFASFATADPQTIPGKAPMLVRQDVGTPEVVPRQAIVDRPSQAPPRAVEDPAPEAERLVEIRFSSTPEADFFVDGEPQGKTPKSVMLPIGVHEIRVKARGYEDWVETIEVAEDGRKSIKVPLRAAKVRATISAEEDHGAPDPDSAPALRIESEKLVDAPM